MNADAAIIAIFILTSYQKEKSSTTQVKHFFLELLGVYEGHLCMGVFAKENTPSKDEVISFGVANPRREVGVFEGKGSVISHKDKSPTHKG